MPEWSDNEIAKIPLRGEVTEVIPLDLDEVGEARGGDEKVNITTRMEVTVEPISVRGKIIAVSAQRIYYHGDGQGSEVRLQTRTKIINQEDEIPHPALRHVA